MASDRVLEFAEIAAGLVPSPTDLDLFYFPVAGDRGGQGKPKESSEVEASPRLTLFKPSKEMVHSKLSDTFTKTTRAFSARVDSVGKRMLYRSAEDPTRKESGPDVEDLLPEQESSNSQDTVEENCGSVTFSLRSGLGLGTKTTTATSDGKVTESKFGSEFAQKSGLAATTSNSTSDEDNKMSAPQQDAPAINSSSGSFLLGVGPMGTNLETPLSWEEPGAYFLECSSKGAFLWSEAAMKYGSKVSDTCLSPKEIITSSATGENSQHQKTLSWESVVNVRWTPSEVIFRHWPSVEAYKACPSENEAEGAVKSQDRNEKATTTLLQEWRLPFVSTDDCPDPTRQKRYAIVTLMEFGDYAELI